ncbi:hypothetical protein H7J87_11940 [Mycolicibacterium wolinskyi]|uniref:Uncharacterized protein n=1 Tax=Mycolicibacterium wolinskyi TaxID=59750 RepID=A0A1X2FJ38_9MYCO|nr:MULTISPECIES: hypothetical protein [Mycolicibacterium]MCV7286042.1 hypothetical protein [Mycolicibacterium wolinskyi]MCV7296238.1 hypothetical protein [Mycolicibacterium goodii]ORX18471.1 hypothetical protein AWC31_14300 [Mycolicibacterium wolinskyi]
MDDPKPQLPQPLTLQDRPHHTPARRRGLPIITAIAASVAAIAAVVAAGYTMLTYKTNQLGISGAIKPGYEAVCIAYSDFVLNQAANGYTPEQIQRVIDFAGSHTLLPGRPDQYHMPNRWPSISDPKACGTPAQIIEQARPKP